MSILSDIKLLEKVYDKELIIEPFIYGNIQPSSIDLTLDNTIKIFKASKQDINIYEEISKDLYDEKILDKYIIKPSEMILGQIKETIHLSDSMNGQIQNRNSLIRKGINVGLSTYINPGYKGKLPIVIQNIGTFNIQLVPGMRICQLVIQEVKPPVKVGYGNRKDAKYHDEKEITLPKLHEDVEFKEYIQKYGMPEGTKIKQERLIKFFTERIKKKSSNPFENLSPEQKEFLGLK